jgi:3-oxoacyl-[acyl-carrier-protein] synthase III
MVWIIGHLVVPLTASDRNNTRMKTYLQGIAYCLPETVRTNEDLVKLNPGWNSAGIYAKTGIRSRRITAAGETAADLGFRAATNLIETLPIDRSTIDALIFCTQSADYLLPASACLLQSRLGLPSSCAAFDFGLGCSGFVYGLWLAQALAASGAAANILLIAGDTLSKYCNPHDLVTATIFGDGAAATLITATPDRAVASLGPTVVGTDGRGGPHLIVKAGGARLERTSATAEVRRDTSGNQRSDEQLYMNGPEIYGFTLMRVHAGIQQLLDKAGLGWSDIDLFLLHQANHFMLEQLRKQMNIPAEKMPIDLETIGNTGSAALPILLSRCQTQKVLRPGQRCVVAGFGIGFSWSMMLLDWCGS